jgi:hypothetical protein
MKTEDRKRQNVAISELNQALALFKLASRSLVDIYERNPKHRETLRFHTNVYHSWFQEDWDNLIGVMELDDRREYVIPADAKPTAQDVVSLIFKVTGDQDVAVTTLHRLVERHPEMLPWGAELVNGLWNSANYLRQSFGRLQITLRHKDRLAKLGKPDPIGIEAGEPTRSIEPPLRSDAEYAAWEAANPADAILPPSGPEDFVAKHGDGSVTRLRDLASVYEAGLIDRPWGPMTRNWELDLIHDLILVRACAHGVNRISDSHLNWWLKPMKGAVRTLDPDALLETAKALIAGMMSSQPMLITSLGDNRGGGWMPTHAGRAIVEEKLLPQWPSVTPNGGQL